MEANGLHLDTRKSTGKRQLSWLGKVTVTTKEEVGCYHTIEIRAVSGTGAPRAPPTIPIYFYA